MGTKSNPSQFDCYNRAKPDEPIFILLGHDPDGADTVRDWIERRRARINRGYYPREDFSKRFEQLREAQSCANAMERYYNQYSDSYQLESADNPFRSIHRRLDDLDEQSEKTNRSLCKALTMLQSLTKLEKREMATLAEVQADIEALKVEAASNGDIAQSAVTLIHRLIDMIGNAAASATDLDGLKSSLESITTTVHASAQDLGDAVAAAPSS